MDRIERTYVVAVGKAAAGMARAAADALGDRLVAGVVTSGAADDFDKRWRRFPASHPLPSDGSEAAGRAALALAARVTDSHALLLVCLSGGASAMLAVPAPGLTLDDKRRTSQAMLVAGLDIGAMNVVRRHLSAVKGGQLAAAAFQTVTLE